MESKTRFYLILVTLFASLISAANGQTFSVIYTFAGRLDGANPFAGVTIQGNALYGTTSGGPYNCGTVYQLAHSGSNWLISPLAALPYNCIPYARVVFGPDGHLYGTSYDGGTYRAGTVFDLTSQAGPCRDAACYWRVNDVHDFGSGADGNSPYLGDLIWDQQGDIYGTTQLGGTSDLGTVYKLTSSGNGYTESVLYSFSGGADGGAPLGGLVLDKKGNLFGTTEGGGANGSGTVFELTYVVGVGWMEQALYSFENASDGESPVGGLVFDSAGNLYGTTLDGGSDGGGTVFELSPSGNTWTFKLLYSFSGPSYCGPGEPLTMDAAGNLYGTTYCGGIYINGSVFKLINTQNGWVYTSLHDLTGGTDGGELASNVSIDTDGTFYGTTEFGGDMNCSIYQPPGCGVVWMIKP